jgi:hypothetical protein
MVAGQGIQRSAKPHASRAAPKTEDIAMQSGVSSGTSQLKKPLNAGATGGIQAFG